MSKKTIKPQLKGRVTEVGHELSSTGQSTEVYALVKVKLTYLRGEYLERMSKAEEKLRELNKMVLGLDVVIHAR